MPHPAPVSISADIDALLQRAVEEAARLLHADGGIVYLVDDDAAELRLSHDAGITSERSRAWVRGLRLPIGSGMFGTAFATRHVQLTGDYPDDRRFPHNPDADRVVAEVAIRSMVVAPLLDGERALGALGAFAARPDAFGDADVALVRALAEHAAAAMTNRRLIEELARSEAELLASREELARRADVERSLREIGARITALHDVDDVIRRTIGEAVRLLGGEGGRIDVVQPDSGLLRGLYLAGDSPPSGEVWPETPDEQPDDGVAGQAVVRNAVVRTGDYLADGSFPHASGVDAFVRTSGIRSVIAAPLPGESGPFGALTVYSSASDAFAAADEATLAALAEQAAVALTNARLIAELAASREELIRRAAAEHALGEISGALAGIRQPSAVLQRVVDETHRLVGADGTILSVLDPDGATLRWAYDDGLRSLFDPEYVANLTLPLGVGPTGVAVAERRPVRVDRDLIDAFPAGPENDRFFDTTGFRSIVCVPIVAEDGPLGALEVYSCREAAFGEADEALLASLAAQAAIALTNARLVERLRASEERYRFLVENSPDVVYATDREGRFTFLTETIEAMTGFTVGECLGSHFSLLVDETSMPAAAATWDTLIADPAVPRITRLLLRRRDGGLVPVEVSSIGTTDEAGRFTGIHGATRDVSERERLERDLRGQAAELAANEERAHLARELHDSVTQALFSMTLMTRSVELLLDRNPAVAREKLDALRDLQRDALAEMRSLIFELRPGSLEQDGLVQALRTHAAAVEGRVGLPVLLDADELERLPAEVEEALYRIAQEALHNVVKHADARQVRIVLRREGGEVRLRVEDDGKGFDPAAVPPGHLGLAGMRARAERIGADLVVASSARSGTRVEVTLPATRAGAATGATARSSVASASSAIEPRSPAAG